MIFVGCSPCQFWSKVHTNRTKNEATAYLLREFERIVEWFKPGSIIIENVPGLLTKGKEYGTFSSLFHSYFHILREWA